MGQGPESVGQAPGQAGAYMGRGGSPCLSLEDDHLTQKIYFLCQYIYGEMFT